MTQLFLHAFLCAHSKKSIDVFYISSRTVIVTTILKPKITFLFEKKKQYLSWLFGKLEHYQRIAFLKHNGFYSYRKINAENKSAEKWVQNGHFKENKLPNRAINRRKHNGFHRTPFLQCKAFNDLAFLHFSSMILTTERRFKQSFA